MTRAYRDVLVAGATGLVGRSVVELLLADDRVTQVHAVLRRSTGTEHPKLREIRLDFDDLAARPDALPGNASVQAAFCCLGTTRAKAGSAEAFRRVDLDYVQAFARAARAAGATAFALNSSVGADAGSRNLYPSKRANPHSSCKYYR